jgi:hypothetical protein
MKKIKPIWIHTIYMLCLGITALWLYDGRQQRARMDQWSMLPEEVALVDYSNDHLNRELRLMAWDYPSPASVQIGQDVRKMDSSYNAVTTRMAALTVFQADIEEKAFNAMITREIPAEKIAELPNDLWQAMEPYQERLYRTMQLGRMGLLLNRYYYYQASMVTSDHSYSPDYLIPVVFDEPNKDITHVKVMMTHGQSAWGPVCSETLQWGDKVLQKDIYPGQFRAVDTLFLTTGKHQLPVQYNYQKVWNGPWFTVKDTVLVQVQ